jgi:hypothetical protein
MNIGKLLECINNMDKGHNFVIQGAINHTLQEIVDFDNFNEYDPKEISTDTILSDIEKAINKSAVDTIYISVLEFCITNYYTVHNQLWNCVEYLLKTQTKELSNQDKKYLKALNKSYMSIYQVMSVKNNESVILKNLIEKSIKKVTVYDKSFSNQAKKGQFVGARVVKVKDSSKLEKNYLSAVLIPLPKSLVKNAVPMISTMHDAMSNKMLFSMFSGGEELSDNARNKLLTKKMWAKEITEQWYQFYANGSQNRQILDHDGNPFKPCRVIFDTIDSKYNLKNILLSIENFAQDNEDSDSILWLDKEYKNLDYDTITKNIPENKNVDESFLHQGLFITSADDDVSYGIYAIIALKDNQLTINTNSFQRANIAQDFIEDHLQNKVKNPKIEYIEN